MHAATRSGHEVCAPEHADISQLRPVHRSRQEAPVRHSISQLVVEQVKSQSAEDVQTMSAVPSLRTDPRQVAPISQVTSLSVAVTLPLTVQVVPTPEQVGARTPLPLVSRRGRCGQFA